MRSICYARNAARRFQPSCTKWPTRMRRSYAQIAGRAATAILRRLPTLYRGRDPSEGFLRGLVSDRSDRCPCHSSVDSGAAQLRTPTPKRLVARLPFWRPRHPIRMGTNMSAEKVDLLCDDCGQAFSDFLNE